MAAAAAAAAAAHQQSLLRAAGVGAGSAAGMLVPPMQPLVHQSLGLLASPPPPSVAAARVADADDKARVGGRGKKREAGHLDIQSGEASGWTGDGGGLGQHAESWGGAAGATLPSASGSIGLWDHVRVAGAAGCSPGGLDALVPQQGLGQHGMWAAAGGKLSWGGPPAGGAAAGPNTQFPSSNFWQPHPWGFGPWTGGNVAAQMAAAYVPAAPQRVWPPSSMPPAGPPPISVQPLVSAPLPSAGGWPHQQQAGLWPAMPAWPPMQPLGSGGADGLHLKGPGGGVGAVQSVQVPYAMHPGAALAWQQQRAVQSVAQPQLLPVASVQAGSPTA